jgi:tetratricopeptide (TPR) repeat protein
MPVPEILPPRLESGGRNLLVAPLPLTLRCFLCGPGVYSKETTVSAPCKLVLPALLAFGVLGLAWADPPTPPGKEQIARWIQQLGDDNFTTREDAARQLWEAGTAAEEPLRAALKSTDPEVVRRARTILDKFKWGLYPDTPKPVVERVRRYRQGDRSERIKVVQELFELGSKGCAVLVKIARADEDADSRRDLFQQINDRAASALPTLAGEGDFSTLDELIELTVSTEQEGFVQNYAAYWLMRDKLDDKIAQLRKPSDLADPLREQLLALLYRARGDLPAARDAAARAQRQDLVEAVLAEMGDWKTLAKRSAEAPGTSIELLGFRTAYHRLAGERDEFEQDVAALVKRVEETTGEDESWLAAKALLLNGRPQEGIPLLVKHRKAARAGELLLAQMKLPEALETVTKARDGAGNDNPDLDVVRGRILYLLGEKDRALEVFNALAGEVKEGQNALWHDKLVETEFRLGLKEQAFDHCARVLGLTQQPANQVRLLARLFPRHADAVEVWWKFLRQKDAAEEAGAALKRLRELVGDRPAAKDLEGLAREAAQAAEALTPPEHEKWLLVLGETCLAAGLEDAARGYLELAVKLGASARAAIKLGDFWADKKRWERAAEVYGQAWQHDQKEPLGLYLQGWALAQGGSDKEGKRRMELAHWVPLGNEYRRSALAAALKARGQREAARREWELLLRTGRPGTFQTGEALRQLALAAVSRKEFLEAAGFHERSVLRVLRPSIYYLEMGANVTVPHYSHHLRARGLAAAGRLDEALHEVEACTALIPGHTDVVIHVLPALEKGDRKKAADDLFERCWALHEKLAADYPKSGFAHNSLAWLGAGCRRHLDAALEHARKAAELAPGQAGYLDTLAEVHFQRGDKGRAVELMRKCLALDGKNGYYRRQLERFEAGDRLAPIPPSVAEE